MQQYSRASTIYGYHSKIVIAVKAEPETFIAIDISETLSSVHANNSAGTRPTYRSEGDQTNLQICRRPDQRRELQHSR